MRFLLGLLLGYSIRGKKPLLIATLSAIAFVAFVCFVVLPAVALLPLRVRILGDRPPVRVATATVEQKLIPVVQLLHLQNSLVPLII
jgi:hypothetical protein